MKYEEMIQSLASEILEEAYLEKIAADEEDKKEEQEQEVEEDEEEDEEENKEAYEYDPVLEKIAAKLNLGAIGQKVKSGAKAYADTVKGKGVAAATQGMDPKYLKEMAKSTAYGVGGYADEAKALLKNRAKARAKQVGAIAAPAALAAGGAAAIHRKATEKAAEYLDDAANMKQAAMEVLAEAQLIEDAAIEVLAEIGYFDAE